ncbi:MAG: hypothetical protein AAF550_09770 [Myxococcota bacterium]
MMDFDVIDEMLRRQRKSWNLEDSPRQIQLELPQSRQEPGAPGEPSPGEERGIVVIDLW